MVQAAITRPVLRQWAIAAAVTADDAAVVVELSGLRIGPAGTRRVAGQNIADDARVNPADRIKAIQTLGRYGVGEMRSLELSGPEGGPIVTTDAGEARDVGPVQAIEDSTGHGPEAVAIADEDNLAAGGRTRRQVLDQQPLGLGPVDVR